MSGVMLRPRTDRRSASVHSTPRELPACAQNGYAPKGYVLA